MQRSTLDRVAGVAYEAGHDDALAQGQGPVEAGRGSGAGVERAREDEEVLARPRRRARLGGEELVIVVPGVVGVGGEVPGEGAQYRDRSKFSTHTIA